MVQVYKFEKENLDRSKPGCVTFKGWQGSDAEDNTDQTPATISALMEFLIEKWFFSGYFH